MPRRTHRSPLKSFRPLRLRGPHTNGVSATTLAALLCPEQTEILANTSTAPTVPTVRPTSPDPTAPTAVTLAAPFSEQAHEQAHTLSGAYVTDALTDAERALFEAHLDECDTCDEEVWSLREATALLGCHADAALPEASPSPNLRAAILAGITQIRPLPPLPTPPRRDTTHPAAHSTDRHTVGTESNQGHPDIQSPAGADSGSRVVVRIGSHQLSTARALMASAAAVALLAAGSSLGGSLLADRLSGDQGVPMAQAPANIDTAVAKVLDAPDATRVTRPFRGGGQVVIVHSAELGQAILMTKNLPDPGEGKVYEVWLSRSGTHTAAGLLPAGSDSTLLLAGDASTAEAVGITVEPMGGSVSPNLASAQMVYLNT